MALRRTVVSSVHCTAPLALTQRLRDSIVAVLPAALALTESLMIVPCFGPLLSAQKSTPFTSPCVNHNER